MSMLLVHELHEARDRILLLKQHLLIAKEREIPAYLPFLTEQIRLLDDTLEQAKIPERYRVAVVGRFKVGKSQFVNKLTGERLAGVDTNPETAAISVFRYDLNTRAEVELISKEDWDELAAEHASDPKNPELKRYDSLTTFNERPAKKEGDGKKVAREKIDLKGLVQKWVQPGGKLHVIPSHNWDSKEGKRAFLAEVRKFTSSQEPLHYLVNRLTIYAPIPILRDQIEIIDTPGLDDTERFRVLLTEDLVKDVDAILFLTISGASYSQSDKDFIVRQLRRRQIKHLQLIVTKCDETFENAERDAKESDDQTPTFKEFCLRETSRVKEETQSTLNELLQSNQLSDDDGYYFIQQLDEVPVQLISAKYHDAGDIERGGIEAVKDGLYHILSTSQRFEQARTVLRDRLELVLKRLRGAFSERRNTLDKEFDPTKVREEIEAVRQSLSSELEFFGERLGEARGLLGRDQEAFFQMLPVHLDLVAMQAKEVLSDLEKADLVRHWKTRRHGYWGYLSDLQAKIADKVFPKVEAVLNMLLGHLDTFMESAGQRMTVLQERMMRVEEEHRLTGLEPIALATTQTPMLEDLRESFRILVEAERDGIVTNLDDFVTEEVQDRLNNARGAVSQILGRGTTLWQNQEVSEFYGEVRRLLAQALRAHLESRIEEFAKAIGMSAESVAPRIREISEEIIQRRLEAIKSALQIEADGKKEEVSAFLSEMLTLFANFATQPLPVGDKPVPSNAPGADQKQTLSSREIAPSTSGLLEQHYEIAEGAVGYTYERIFRPYIDTATMILVEEPYVRAPYQVDNFARFCALAIRLGSVKYIKLVTGQLLGEATDDLESRLETLRRDLQLRGITFSWSYNSTLHDREVKFDNGWVVKIGRGLDIYLKPESWVSVEAADFSMRRCRQTKVDIYQTSSRLLRNGAD